MTTPRDPDEILAAWLDEGPTRLPAQTRRAIAVAIPTTPQRRRGLAVPWRSTTMSTTLKLALGAAAVFAVVLGGAFFLGPPAQDRSVGGQPTASPSAASTAPVSPTASIPAMTQGFTSTKYGYSLRYPAGWIAAAGEGPSAGGGSDVFNPPSGSPVFRALSAVVPEGVVVDTWISGELTNAGNADCDRPRETLEAVTIDGQAGRLRGYCGTPPAQEIEATVIVGDRVYLLTLFDYPDGADKPTEAQSRALFDAFAATIKFDPPGADGSPSPGPS